MVYIGTYKHYKGGVYEVVEVGKHTETGEMLVVYKDSAGDVHIRPETMFASTVEVEGKVVKRFSEHTVNDQ